jgi:hypothetical protein
MTITAADPAMPTISASHVIAAAAPVKATGARVVVSVAFPELVDIGAKVEVIMGVTDGRTAVVGAILNGPPKINDRACRMMPVRSPSASVLSSGNRPERIVGMAATDRVLGKFNKIT